MILPLLICLTAAGFNCPSRVTGVLAFARYESPERTEEAAETASRRRGRWRVVKWKAVRERPRERPRVWGRKRGRRRKEDIFDELWNESEGLWWSLRLWFWSWDLEVVRFGEGGGGDVVCPVVS